MKRLVAALLFANGCAKATTPTPQPVEAPAAVERPALEVRVITAPESMGAVNSTLLIGDDAVVVVDAQFTATGAGKVIDAVKATGKPLTHLFITHGHPDHYLGTSLFKEAFPDVVIVASPEVVDDLIEASKDAVPRVKGMLGPEFPGEPILPERFDEDTLTVSGRTVTLLRGLQGDTEPVTGLWLEDQGTLIVSDVGFSGVHAWTADGDAAARTAWRAQLDTLVAKPGLKTVVPGHQLVGSDRSPALLTATSNYLAAYDEVASRATDAPALIQGMQVRYPKLGGQLFLQIGAAARFPSE